MLALSFSDLGTTGAIVAIFIAFIVFGLVKGLVRTAFALVALALGIAAGLWGFWKGESIAGTLVSEPDPWMSFAVGLLLGAAIFFVARALFGVLLSPVGAKDGKAKNLPVPGALLGIIMGAAFAWFCLSGIRYIGTLAELETLHRAIADPTKIEKVKPSPFARLKRLIDSSGPGKFHQKLDFLNHPAHANLAKLTVLRENKVAWTRAGSKDRKAYDVIYHTDINSLIITRSADLKPFIEKSQYSHLLHSDIIKDFCKDETVRELLLTIDVEKAIGLLEEEKKEDEDDAEES